MSPAAPEFRESASRWIEPELLEVGFATLARAAFWRGSPIPHLCLDSILLPEAAESIAAALASAAFEPHAHPGYPIEVAPRSKQAGSACASFVDWLASGEAAAFHAWLVGWRLPEAWQPHVQVARYGVGAGLPVHEDEQGLAAIYGFTGGWSPECGGLLSCYHPETGQELLRVEPRFNTVFLFRTQAAPHGVSPILPAAGARRRYTITALYHDPA